MTSALQDLDIFRRLAEILDDEEGLEELLKHSRRTLVQCLTEPQRRRWAILMEHNSHTPKIMGDADAAEEDDDGNGGDDDDGGQEGTPLRSKRRRAANAGPRDPFSKISSAKALDLPEHHALWIAQYGCDDVSLYLNDHIPLEVRYQDQDGEAKALANTWRYGSHLLNRKTKDRVRWFFVILFYFDLGRLMRPGGSGRIGKKMFEQIQDLVKKGLKDKVHLEYEQVKSWSLQGSRINMFCESFGVGCLFFIEHLVTEDFLKRRCALSGEYRDNAFRHLANLGLSRMAQNSGADELGENIRAFLIHPFLKAQIVGTSELITPTTVASITTPPAAAAGPSPASASTACLG